MGQAPDDKVRNFFSRAMNKRAAMNFRKAVGSSNSSVTANGTIGFAQSGNPPPERNRARSFSVVTGVNPSRAASAIRLSISDFDNA